MIIYLIKERLQNSVAENLFKNPLGSLIFYLLPRCRSGCKDAIILNACQVLFSLIFKSFFYFAKIKKLHAFRKAASNVHTFRLPAKINFQKNYPPLINICKLNNYKNRLFRDIPRQRNHYRNCYI